MSHSPRGALRPPLLPPLLILPAVLLLAACAEDGTEGDLDPGDVAAIADFFARQADLPGGGDAAVRTAVRSAPRGAAAAVAPPFTIDRGVSCPEGGTLDVDGSGERTPDAEARETAVTWSATAVHTDCAISTPRGTLALDSDGIEGTGAALWAWPETQGGEFTLLSFTLTRAGSFDWSVGASTGACALSLTSTYDPQDGWATSGTVCGEAVENTRAPVGWGGG